MLSHASGFFGFLFCIGEFCFAAAEDVLGGACQWHLHGAVVALVRDFPVWGVRDGESDWWDFARWQGVKLEGGSLLVDVDLCNRGVRPVCVFASAAVDIEAGREC